MKKEENKYTGRQIAILTDCHSLLEPLEAVLDDINKRGITEIYSLGDNIGVGPNPNEVVDLLNEKGVISIAGNSEDYCTLGIEPFNSYFDIKKTKSQMWTLSQLKGEHINSFKLYLHSIDLLIGGKNVALCHFCNDVRIDFLERSCWTYIEKVGLGEDAYKQFLYTNSPSQKEEIDLMLKKHKHDEPYLKGYLHAKEHPLFDGKTIFNYDAIIQGHLHFKRYEKANNTEIYSIRGLGIAYENDPINSASYIIVKEKTNNNGFDIEEVLIEFDREKMKEKILKNDYSYGLLKKYTNIK